MSIAVKSTNVYTLISVSPGMCLRFPPPPPMFFRKKDIHSGEHGSTVSIQHATYCLWELLSVLTWPPLASKLKEAMDHGTNEYIRYCISYA